MSVIEIFNRVILIVFFVCYSYQFFYIAVSLLPRRKKNGTGVPWVPSARIAVLIAARNEAQVIGGLLDSIADQDYPAELVRVFVAADNCTDRTASVARAHGAEVFTRFDREHVGKGYVLQFLLDRIEGLSGLDSFDAFVVLDADNILDHGFLTAITKTHSSGYEIVTCYRNSKNYGDNWISAGYALWFLREAQYLNGARMRLGVSCAVSGTGFLFSREVLRTCSGWPFHLLTEDIEFTADNLLRGVKIGYSRDAVLYDEQPTDFMQSYHQRLRWARGYLQVFGKYGKHLLSVILRGSFSCFDMTMNILPMALLSGTGLIVNLTAGILGAAGGGALPVLLAALKTFGGFLGTLFIIGLITTVTEWKQIHAPTPAKLRAVFTFPFFMLTYLPICAAALFVTPDWKPIRHCRTLGLREIEENGQENRHF